MPPGGAFQQTQDESVGTIFAAEFCRFSNVSFRGNRTFPTDQGIGAISLLNIGSTPVLNTRNISFYECSFTNGTYVARLDNDMQNIVFSGGYFSELYQPFKIGELTDGLDASTVGPKGVRIMNNYFDSIASTAIRVYEDIQGVTSAYNYYREVGNGYAGPGNAVDAIIIFEDDNNTSIGDMFERDDADELVFPRVQHIGTSTIVQYPGELQLGALRQQTGRTMDLADGVTDALTGIEITSPTPVMFIDYSIRRNTALRVGTMKLIQLAGSQFQLEDDFTDNGVSDGIVFAMSEAGDGLIYTSSATGIAAEFKYAIRYIN